MPGLSQTDRLRQIAFAGKAHWGYDERLVREWADSLSFPPEERLLVEDGGWAAVAVRGDVCWLDDLWVEPASMGKGVGRRLFERAAVLGRELGCVRMEWESDPNAVAFYERMGARYLRDSDVTEWGRVLPVMGVSLVE